MERPETAESACWNGYRRRVANLFDACSADGRANRRIASRHGRTRKARPIPIVGDGRWCHADSRLSALVVGNIVLVGWCGIARRGRVPSRLLLKHPLFPHDRSQKTAPQAVSVSCGTGGGEDCGTVSRAASQERMATRNGATTTPPKTSGYVSRRLRADRKSEMVPA